jgi:hypothetical protein
MDCVYDITLAYDDNNRPLSLIDACAPYWLKGGRTVHIYIKRYKISEIKNMKEEEMSSWLIDVWKNKEENLSYFKKNQQFNHRFDLPYKVEPMNLFE